MDIEIKKYTPFFNLFDRIITTTFIIAFLHNTNCYSQKTVYVNSIEIGQGLLRKRTFDSSKFYHLLNTENYLILPYHVMGQKSASKAQVTSQEGLVSAGKLIKSYPQYDVAILALQGDEIKAASWKSSREIQEHLTIDTHGTIETVNVRGSVDIVDVRITKIVGSEYIYILPVDSDDSFTSGMSGSLLKINGISSGMLLETNSTSGEGKVIRLDFMETLVAPFFRFYQNKEFHQEELSKKLRELQGDIRYAYTEGYIILREPFQEKLFYLSRYVKSISFGEKYSTPEFKIQITDLIDHYFNNIGSELKIPYGKGSSNFSVWFELKDNTYTSPVEVNLFSSRNSINKDLIISSTSEDLSAPTIYVDYKYKARFNTIPGTIETIVFFDDLEGNNYSLPTNKIFEIFNVEVPKGSNKLTLKFIMEDNSIKRYDYKIMDWEYYKLLDSKNTIIDYVDRKKMPLILCQCAQNEESLGNMGNLKYVLRKKIKHFPVTYCYDILSYKNNRFTNTTIKYTNWNAIKRIRLKGNNPIFNVLIDINTAKAQENLSYNNLYKETFKAFRVFFKILDKNPKNLMMTLEFFDGTYSKILPIDIKKL
ncbi:hypothetical protein [Aquimarina sp. AU474]|uniref:hypothetical protein n=1 Tax=Aquimarina sp. AU474 TaxID=2108529 RepID=UPI000D6880FD|nr:hypothetical protein [Aquimarina sp. AU474]